MNNSQQSDALPEKDEDGLSSPSISEPTTQKEGRADDIPHHHHDDSVSSSSSTPVPAAPLKISDHDDTQTTYSLSELDPPASRLERHRDWWLRFLGGNFHFWVGVVVMLLVIADGAFFFFLLIGAHKLCRPRTDCEPRNYWYNWSIQFLNVLFSYLATITLPWRISNAVHLFGRKRPSKPGLDLYGQPTEEIWFHLRQVKKKVIVIFLLLNSATQWANQATRIVFYSYELQDTFPGSLWTNLFFVISMMCAAVGGFCQLHEEIKLRKQHPERFPPGLTDLVKHYLRVVCCRKKRCSVEECEHDIEDQRPLPEREESERKRCLHGLRKLVRNDKTSLDLWGL